MSALIVSSTAAVPSRADPPTDTDHGIEEETFNELWSGDRDDSANHEQSKDGTAIEQLSSGTDFPFDSPPRAVEQWNRGDHQDFPSTNGSVSIHPPDASLTNRRFIEDAYTAVFAVQPSTRARLSPSRQPLYVAPEGTLLGTVDYRVVVPPDDTSGDWRVNWNLESHQIDETRLLVNGVEESTGHGGHRPALPYTLDGHPGEESELTLQANISVQLRKAVRTCEAHDNNSCVDWETSVSYPTEQFTVTDSIRVTRYDLIVSGFVARYPNGDAGTVVYKNQPWLGYGLPDGEVRGVWRFYSARDSDWDRLVYSSASDQRTTHSPLHPLQLYAYPIETGPTPSPRRNVTILDAFGTSTDPPQLPSGINLDALEEPYTASYGIATRVVTTRRVKTIRAWGLVRGVEAKRSVEEFERIPIHESNLTLTALNQTRTTVTLRIELRESVSGDPIDTGNRTGHIVIDGEQVNTTDDGTVTTTIERGPGGVSARFEPGRWWRHPSGYTGDTETVLVNSTVLDLLSALFRLGLPVSLFLVAVFLIDRVTGWRLWPPWRQL